ncbi:NCKP5 protein, partial [Sapayoa aenigma]|nr:NCKP5 protein [Sapayoa aenigma]
FSRMEETVRNLLQSQGSPGQHGEGTVNIMKVYQEKLSEDSRRCKEGMEKIHTVADEDSRSENSSTEEEKEKTKLLLERLKALEVRSTTVSHIKDHPSPYLFFTSFTYFFQVANQVVQALLTQKGLREECIKLKMRVFDLEQQNRTLSVLFQQKVKPASDLLLQKLHSRILDLSSGDLLSEVELNRSLMQARTADAQIHECQQNVKSSIPVLKCQSQLNMTGSSRLYPRSSCSSSELSLSSACSEYSSGSSYTWNDGKTCSRRSSMRWDKRISIGSSLPSNLSSPADDLPPTRIKENHILEGLKKLQKQKILLESPSVISKWGYKDCMNSNEGIYSPGVKCGGHNEQTHCKPVEMGSICIEHNKTFTYDSDSHDDADDDSSSLLLLQEVPSKDCRTYCNKLTHSISDSLFDWDPNRKHLPERSSYFNSKERPEKLTSFVGGFQAEVPKPPTHPLPDLKRPCRGDGSKYPKSQSPASPMLPQHLIEPSNYGEPPTRDIHCDLATVEARSPSPPLPPGRSTSLLIRPNYAHSSPLAVKLGGAGPPETAKNIPKSSPLKGTVISGFHNESSHEMQAKNVSSYLQENAEGIMQNKCASQQSYSACQGLSKVSTKQVCPKNPNQLGLHRNCEYASKDFETDRSFSLGCPSLEATSSQDTYSIKKNISSESGVDQLRKIPNILPTTPQCHTTSTSEPLLSQVNNSPSTLFHASDTAHATQNSNEKGMKTRLPVGLKLFVRSPQLLRKSSTVPGKQEKDSINAASKSNVSSCKYKQSESVCVTTRGAAYAELKDPKSDTEVKNNFTVGLSMDTASPHSHESCSLVVDRVDGLENKLVKRSVSSSNKSHLKPALGMNGAKARSQSFSIHTGEKPSAPVTEGLGKVRTQIITNTSDRGNSLTRQNSAMEGLQIKAIPGSAVTPETLLYTTKPAENSYPRQGSLGNMSNCNTQHGSPSKLPFRSSPKVDSFHNTSKCNENRPFSQKDARSRSMQSERSTEIFKDEALSKKTILSAELELEASTTVSSKQILSFHSFDGIKCPHKLEATKSRRQQMSLKLAETSEKVNDVLSSPALQPTIEEKVMLCIQENVQKGQGQTKSPTMEPKQKTGPSIASWFGFRKSKLPALSSRKTDVPKTKVEKK